MRAGFCGFANNPDRIAQLDRAERLASSVSEITRIKQAERKSKKDAQQASLLDLAPKAVAILRSKGNDVTKITVREITSILGRYFGVAEPKGDKATSIGDVARIKIRAPCAMGASPKWLPEEFRCPLTLDVMDSPVFLCTEAGRSFERKALERWLKRHPRRDPLTNAEYAKPLAFMPNRALKEAIERWQQPLQRTRSSIVDERCELQAAQRSPSTLALASKSREDASPSRDLGTMVDKFVRGESTAVVKVLKLVATNDDNAAIILAAEGVGEALARVIASRDDTSLAAAGLVEILGARAAVGLEGLLECCVAPLVAAIEDTREPDLVGAALAALLELEPLAPLMLRLGASASLVALLKHSALETPAARLLAALAARASKSPELAVALKPLGRLVAAQSHGARRFAASALAEVVANNPAVSRAVGKIAHIFEGLDAMLRAQRDQPEDALQAARLLNSLFAGTENNMVLYVRAAGSVAGLVGVVQDADDLDAKTQAATALAHIAGSRLEFQREVAASGVVKPIGRLLRDRCGADPRAKTAAALFFVALAAGNSENQGIIATEGIVGPLVAILQQPPSEPKPIVAIALRWLIDHREARLVVAKHLGFKWVLVPPSKAAVDARIGEILPEHRPQMPKKSRDGTY
ncbi:hypothetical protein CTAYLR_004593 [Chrysophaeum taylorii]|uniref:RING-type E3 ubiquitin transferase n=1 Tax=Chrysophaeum taylorii TaxID=2483200 RepID=A0AAD7UEC8_9STRA|nr:hypothetical protein CTAYLR_004593 [Chrysophaeum taylorii]